MDIKRRIGLSAGILAIGLGAGHLMQTRAAKADAVRQQTVTEAALPGAPAPVATAQPAPAAPVRLASITDGATRALPPAGPVPAPSAATAADPCRATLELVAQPRAMIGLSLRAPCNANERVVLRHAGLAVTARTSATGALFTTLPALAAEARVSVLFRDAGTAEARLPVPDAAATRRFVVQWVADDGFQLNAFEDGADYGTPGHLRATDTVPAPDALPGKGGFIAQFGDAGVPLPMLAQVYTYPADPTRRAEIVVEAPVDAGTCGRELLAETLSVRGGTVAVDDLAVSMPDCTAVGDILVLKNLDPATTVTAAN